MYLSVVVILAVTAVYTVVGKKNIQLKNREKCNQNFKWNKNKQEQKYLQMYNKKIVKLCSKKNQ